MSAFTTHLPKYCNDTVHWAFSLKVNDKELASNDSGNVIVTLDSEGGMSFEMPASVNDIISFMKGMKHCFNNGNGILDIVTFLGVDYIDDMQMVCHIQQSDGTELLTVLQMLNFIKNPDIASIPQTNEEYYDKCHYLDPSDLEKTMHPQALSPLQEKMMSQHCCLHHTPFPRLIVMAELGEIPKQLAQLRD